MQRMLDDAMTRAVDREYLAAPRHMDVLARMSARHSIATSTLAIDHRNFASRPPSAVASSIFGMHDARSPRVVFYG
jgi:hypothetical protein